MLFFDYFAAMPFAMRCQRVYFSPLSRRDDAFSMPAIVQSDAIFFDGFQPAAALLPLLLLLPFRHACLLIAPAAFAMMLSPARDFRR